MTFLDPYRIRIVHENLNYAGGAERVCLGILEVAKEMGCVVDLVTLAPTRWSELEELFGRTERPDREFSVFKGRMPFDHYYGRLLMKQFIDGWNRKSLIVINTMGYSWLPAKADLVYEHTSPYLWPSSSGAGKSLLWKMYYAPYSFLGRRLLRSSTEGQVITNSKYSALMIKWLTGVEPRVLYPPVDVKSYSAGGDHNEPTVVTCGRFGPGKNFFEVLRIAQMKPDLTFVIMGSMREHEGAAFYHRLENQVRKLGLSNVQLLKNTISEEQARRYGASRVFLHLAVGEDFGIAVVEGMASGLIPIVHKSGGVWTDVLGNGHYGLGFNRVGEVPDLIERAMLLDGRIRETTMRRATDFSKEKFKVEANRILRDVIAQRF